MGKGTLRCPFMRWKSQIGNWFYIGWMTNDIVQEEYGNAWMNKK